MIGIPTGLFAGFYGGRTDVVIMRVLDALLAFPALLLAILVVATFGSGLGTVVVALGVIYMPAMARLVRSVTLVQRSRPTSTRPARSATPTGGSCSATSCPTSSRPWSSSPRSTSRTRSSTSRRSRFLGPGQQPPDPDWGSMLSDARSYLLQNPWPAMCAGIAIMLAVISFNLVGDGLRAQLDPRERER